MLLEGQPVADSDEVQLLHPPGRTRTGLFPREHGHHELFEPTARRQSDPGMGERTYWDLRVGQHRAREAAYAWESPPQGAGAIAGLVAFDWDSVTASRSTGPSSPSRRPRMLLESGLPVRWYLPREDVRAELLEPSCTTTRCPYKGIATPGRCGWASGTTRTWCGPIRSRSTTPRRYAGCCASRRSRWSCR